MRLPSALSFHIFADPRLPPRSMSFQPLKFNTACEASSECQATEQMIHINPVGFQMSSDNRLSFSVSFPLSG